MGLFDKSTTIGDSPLLKGFTDWHCHILPGVDDGIKTVEDSLSVLALYEKAGIREVWLTPHIMEDIPNKTAYLRSVFDGLCRQYGGGIKLNLASENMLDSLFEDRLEAGELLPYSGHRLLVETSYFNPPNNFRELLDRVAAKGYFPVLARRLSAAEGQGSPVPVEHTVAVRRLRPRGPGKGGEDPWRRPV